MPSNIPLARAAISSCLATETMSDSVRDIIGYALNLMTRDSPFKKANRHNRMTAEIRDRILVAVRTHPHLPNTEIAVLAGLTSCASGRVTDVMNGKYDHL
jgi:hypothetical protein